MSGVVAVALWLIVVTLILWANHWAATRDE
jgi:hypothetical protein